MTEILIKLDELIAKYSDNEEVTEDLKYIASLIGYQLYNNKLNQQKIIEKLDSIKEDVQQQ